jgi:hypothetical protein
LRFGAGVLFCDGGAYYALNAPCLPLTSAKDFLYRCFYKGNDMHKNIPNKPDLILTDWSLSIVRMANLDQVSQWMDSTFFALCKTANEVSMVLQTALLDQRPSPHSLIARSDDWRCIRVAGTLDFALTGILSGIAGVLAAHEISIFAISSYDTDYILVKQSQINAAVDALSQDGYQFL